VLQPSTIPPSHRSNPNPLLQASAAVELYPDCGPIRLADVQNLVLWVLAEGSNPRWCFVKVGACEAQGQGGKRV